MQYAQAAAAFHRLTLAQRNAAWREVEELRRAVGDVIYGLADLGWGPEEIRYLEEDSEQLFAMVHNRNLLGRVRQPR